MQNRPDAAAAAPLFISLSSFGAAEVRRHGQRWWVQLAAEAGADGVEVRGELLTGGHAELDAIARAAGPLQRVYSSPEGLWAADARLDVAALDRGLAAAARLGATRLKMAIGGWRGGHDGAAAADWAMLDARLAATPVELVIENDQTDGAGTLAALLRFFGAARAAGRPLGMTFDMGNWHWVGECPLRAAARLGTEVRYLHCKGVQREARRWIAVPLADSCAPWRAVLHALPPGLPWAIEYPLAGEDLLAVTRHELLRLRALAEEVAMAAAEVRP